MVEENYLCDNATWEELRRKSRRRRHTSASAWVISMPFLLLAAGIICIFVCVLGFDATAHRSQPLTLPETLKVQSLSVADCVSVEATQFVSGLDGTGIEVRFGQEPDANTLGAQEISLVFTLDNHACTVTTGLYRYHLEQTVTVKLGGEETVSVRDFLPDESIQAVFVGQSPSEITKGSCGVFNLKIHCGGREYPVTYCITEEIAPVGTGKTVTVEAGTIPEPSSFVEKIEDHTQVTVTYKQQPSFITMGTEKVTLVLTDAFGNTSEVEAEAQVVPAANGPQFAGLSDLYVPLGSPVSYRTGVTVTDKQDGNLTFTVDPGNMDIKTQGRYTVYYSAVDTDGNQLIVPRTVIVESVTGQAVRQSAQTILNQIITPGMSRDSQIYAVYGYVRWNVAYVGSSDKSSLENGAYEGFTKKKGDCYTYYAMTRVMLDMLGIENLEVTRVGGTSHHWWNLVLFEDGKYYHVDSSPTRVRLDNVNHNKMTDSDLVVYTNAEGVIERRPNFYVYDKTLPAYRDIEIAQ